MKTLICAINSKFIHSSPAVYSLRTSCRYFSELYNVDAGDVSVSEFSVNDPYDTIVYGIVSENPDIVAISVYIWNVKIVGSLISDLKKMLPDCIIILGGPEVSFGTEPGILCSKDIDFIISGEGEYSLFYRIANIYAEKNGKTLNIPSEKHIDLNEIPFIYNDDNISCFKNRIIYYETSRGCPFNCAYCLSGADSKVKFLDRERVFSEIEFFRKNKVPQVKFVDRTFNCNPRRAKEIVQYISSLEECETNFHFEVGADLFDDEFVEILSKVPHGRVQIEAGIQSMNKNVLDACCRKTDVDKCFENLKRIISVGNINVHTDLIAGLPFEPLEDFIDSFNKAYTLKSHQLQLGFLKLLKGAPLCKMTEEHSYVFSSNPPYEIISNKYISYSEILSLKEVEDALERYYNSGNYLFTLELAEKYFETPYDFYRSMADFIKNKKLIFKPMSLRQSFDIMYMFLNCSVNDSDELDAVKRSLLIDYFSSNKTDMPPDSLKDMWQSERSVSSKTGDIMKCYGIDDFRSHRLRIIDGEIYIFDVSSEDSVTGRYSFIKADNNFSEVQNGQNSAAFIPCE